MDKMAYLQQISDNSSRKANSAKSGLGGLFSGKLLWVTIGALVVVVLFIVLMIATNSGKGNPELESTVRLNARLENLTKTISTYNKQVRLFCVPLYAIDKIYINIKLWDVINEFK